VDFHGDLMPIIRSNLEIKVLKAIKRRNLLKGKRKQTTRRSRLENNTHDYKVIEANSKKAIKRLRKISVRLIQER
jgi:hypothetical protein